MEKSKTGVLLVNVGTPDSPATVDVWKYLRQFLMDGRIIDIPYWRRLLLVNLIIAPFRAPKSAREYQKIWSEKGSPLMYHSCNFRDSVQQPLDNFKWLLYAFKRRTSESPRVGSLRPDKGGPHERISAGLLNLHGQGHISQLLMARPRSARHPIIPRSLLCLPQSS